MIKQIVAIAVVLGFLVVPQAHSAAISGIGSKYCSDFLTDIGGAGGADTEGRYYAWAQGWMSRLNVDRQATGNSYVTNGRIESSSYPVGDSQKYYLRNFCASNRSSLYAEGATSLYLAIVRELGGSV